MKVETGTRLGPYEIVSRIGAGGMGEVYRARDTRLDRSVAIKVLSPDFAAEPDLLARFEREARTISQLNHPNICTIHDVGREGDTDYLVMELLEGETLSDRLGKAPLPLPEVLRYGAQIAEALARAHRQGITHRDLKPGNVMLTKSGAKLLDFGLAKTLVKGKPAPTADEATLQRPLTQEGAVLGTFQYMAPEQLSGEEADARTDIFALGVVLYEMATGARAFTGKNRTSLVASIIGLEPRPISELRPMTPSALEHVIAKCLSKDPEDRWQSAHDIAEELKWIAAAGSQAGALAPLLARRRRSRTMLAALLAALTGAAVAALVTYFAIASRRAPLRFTVSTPDALRIVGPSAGGAVAFSPDGRSIVFIGQDAAGTPRLFTRDLDNFEPKALPLTEGATYPFWSPDGRSIGFFSGGKLKRMDLSGAPPVAVADAPDGRGGAWAKDGSILYAPSITSPLLRVSASGGAARPVTVIAPGDRSHRFPSFFADGDHFVYFKQGPPSLQGVWIGSLSSPAGARLVETRFAAVAGNDDQILYVRDGILLAQHVSLGKQTVTGEARVVAQNVSSAIDRAYQLLSASPTMVVFQAEGTERSTFTWFDRSGKNLGSIGPADEYTEPTFMAGETKVVTGIGGINGLRELDLTSGRVSRFTLSDESYGTSAAAPDGSRVMASDISKLTLVEIVPGKARNIVGQFRKARYPDYFDRTGEILLADGEREDGRGDFDIFIGRRSTGFKLETLLGGRGNETHAQLSPDGRFVAYSSDETGRTEVFVQAVPPTGQKSQISVSGGDQAQWSADGKEIFYLAANGRMTSVPVRSAAPFETGEAVVLFATHIAPASVLGTRNQYLAASDGRRFLLLDPLQSAHSNELNVISNWSQ